MVDLTVQSIICLELHKKITNSFLKCKWEGIWNSLWNSEIFSATGDAEESSKGTTTNAFDVCLNLNGSILKYGKLVYFQNVVNLYLTQAYNAIPALQIIHTLVLIMVHLTVQSLICLKLHKKITNSFLKCKWEGVWNALWKSEIFSATGDAEKSANGTIINAFDVRLMVPFRVHLIIHLEMRVKVHFKIFIKVHKKVHLRLH